MFVWFLPIWLKTGSSDNWKQSLFDPWKESNISGSLIIEVIFCKSHLIHETLEEQHEEKDSQDRVEYTSNKSKSSEELLELPIKIGDDSTILYLHDSLEPRSNIHDSLYDSWLCFKGIGTIKLNYRSDTLVNSKVILI